MNKENYLDLDYPLGEYDEPSRATDVERYDAEWDAMYERMNQPSALAGLTVEEARAQVAQALAEAHEAKASKTTSEVVSPEWQAVWDSIGERPSA